MQIITIKAHSFIDVITNSSTELFVGDQAKGVEFIKAAMDELLVGYDKKYPSEYPSTFESIFGEIKCLTDADVDAFMDTMEGFMDPSDPLMHNIEPYPEYPPYNHSLTREEHQAEWDKQDKRIADWKTNNREQFAKNCTGMIVVVGKHDNSIPYDLFESIEAVFETATRYHLG